MWFVSFLTIALISPFKAFLVLLLLLLFFPVLGTEPRTWCTLGKHWATPSPDYIVSKVTSSFLLIRISFLGGRYQGTGGREEVEPVRAKVAIRSFNCFTVEWFCCVAAGPRIFFSGGSSEIEFLMGLFLTVYESVCAPVKAVPMKSRRRHWIPLGLVLIVAMSHQMCILGTELHTWVLWKSNKCS